MLYLQKIFFLKVALYLRFIFNYVCGAGKGGKEGRKGKGDAGNDVISLCRNV